RDMGFYSIEYSYKVSSHTKLGAFNPDFIIKLNTTGDVYVVLEIKEDSDASPENKGKYRAAREHFKLLNKKLKEIGKNEKYIFHFLSPSDYETFFQFLRENKLDVFVSGLDNLLEEADK
ncbi:MAG: restriction endonuclease subunit R, partial [Negativicoccus succinicivorans]|nr:restriction endonuclease subunit R [Negativicoccus succinicivorans]